MCCPDKGRGKKKKKEGKRTREKSKHERDRLRLCRQQVHQTIAKGERKHTKEEVKGKNLDQLV